MSTDTDEVRLKYARLVGPIRTQRSIYILQYVGDFWNKKFAQTEIGLK